MYPYRLVPIFMFSMFLFGHAPLLMNQANAAFHGCCPAGSCYWWCRCTCMAMVEGCVDKLLEGQEFTLKNDRGLPIEIEAEPDVLQQLVDLRQKGKLDCGTFSLQLIGNVENMKLKCTKFSPKGESQGLSVSQNPMDFTPGEVKEMTDELKESSPEHRHSKVPIEKRIPYARENR